MGMVIIYILAFIGGAAVIGAIVLLLLIIFSTDGKTEDGMHVYCTLMMERCMYDEDNIPCDECPVAEEAGKVGDR